MSMTLHESIIIVGDFHSKANNYKSRSRSECHFVIFLFTRPGGGACEVLNLIEIDHIQRKCLKEKINIRRTVVYM